MLIAPADAVSAAKFIELLSSIKGPAYVRLDRNPLPILYDESYEAVIGKGKVLTEGRDIAVIAIGEAVSEALSAGKELLQQGGPVITVVDMATIKPVDCELLKRLSENHSVFINTTTCFYNRGGAQCLWRPGKRGRTGCGRVGTGNPVEMYWNTRLLSPGKSNRLQQSVVWFR